MTPCVSIICPTYNRSGSLAVAIESVINQTLESWELVVVGDCCTDQTEAVVASFMDDRIRFVNRTENHGDQSAPNNDGIRLTTADVIAFINHDDVWLSDHLEQVTKVLALGHDFVYANCATLDPHHRVRYSSGKFIRKGKVYRVPRSSAWCVRRDLTDRVGDFRSGFELYTQSISDWLCRAVDLGASVGYSQVPSVVLFPSGMRAGSYGTAADLETEFSRVFAGPGGRSALSSLTPSRSTAAQRLEAAVSAVVNLVAVAIGTHPHLARSRVRALIRGQARGGELRKLRERRGLRSVP